LRQRQEISVKPNKKASVTVDNIGTFSPQQNKYVTVSVKRGLILFLKKSDKNLEKVNF